MIQRHKNIVSDLRYSDMTIKHMSKRQNVTERTIRNDLKALNEVLLKYDSEIAKNDSSKYKLIINNVNKFRKFEQEELLNFEFNYADHDDRVKYISLKLLFADDYIKLDDLMDEMYISRSSIQNDMRDVRRIFNNNDLNIESKPNYGMKIVGSEKNIRSTISSFIYEINYSPYFSLNDEIDFIFDKEDIKEIYNILIKNVDLSSIKLSDIALNNLVIHIAIAIKRIKINKYFERKIESDLSKTYEFSIANNIVKDIEDMFNIKFPLEEIYYITMHLIGTKLILDQNIFDLYEKDQEIYHLAKDIINTVDSKMQFEFKNDNELLTSIILHLKPAIYRHKNNMNVRNPLLSDIKLNYPSAYEASIIASDIIRKSLNIKFKEDELGYLAIHFGAAIIRLKNKKENPIRTLLVCATGMGSSKLLECKIKYEFNDELNIISTTELYNLNKFAKEDIELIISTVPLSNATIRMFKNHVSYIYVKDIFGSSALKEIENYLIENRFSLKKCYENDDGDLSFLSLEDIYTNIKLDSKDEVIKFISNELMAKGKVSNNIEELILKRESIIPTSYGNLVAIPHPLEAVTKETFLSVITLNKKINWSDNEVQLVICLCFGSNKNEELDFMYKKLVSLVDNRENVDKIISSKNNREVLDIFKKIIEY